MELSVVIPCYNEEENILNTILSIEEYMIKRGHNFEIIVVNDGSEDRTKKIVESTIEEIKRNNIKLISYKKNRGKGFAVKRGMISASGSVMLFIDGDGDIGISNLDKMLPYLGSHDICLGSKSKSEQKIELNNSCLYRRALSRGGNFLVRRVTGLAFRDTQCGLKIFRRSAAKILFPSLITNGWGFDIELLIRAQDMGYRILEIPVEWRYSKNSKVSWSGYLRTFLELLAVKRLIVNKNKNGSNSKNK